MNRCVVRNEAYRAGAFNVRERHNERKNVEYGNGDILPDRSPMNVHFKACEGTYEQQFHQLVEDGTVSLRGLQKDAHVFDELVFDVNTAYFEEAGGYDYAKAFFEEAYRLAVKEIGGEQYVLSAVMHADERNKAESERLGRDVFHYHLHVTYIPVVVKEVKWSKRCKDPALVGTTKEVVWQVSHSKKWPRIVACEGGRNAYSLLQDHFFEHMREAGFEGFERGERGSTTEHLSTLAYKIQQEGRRSDALDRELSGKEEQAAALDSKLAVKKQMVRAFEEVDGLAKKTIGGNYQLAPEQWKTVSQLAKEGVKSRGIIKGLKEKVAALLKEIASQKAQLERLDEGQSVTDTMRFHRAKQRAPRRLGEVIADIMCQPPEPLADDRQQKNKNRQEER